MPSPKREILNTPRGLIRMLKRLKKEGGIMKALYRLTATVSGRDDRRMLNEYKIRDETSMKEERESV